MIVRVDNRIIILKKLLTFYEVPCYQICRNTYLNINFQFESRPGEVYSIQHYGIKFISDASGRWFSSGTPVSSTNKTDRHGIAESGV